MYTIYIMCIKDIHIVQSVQRYTLHTEQESQFIIWSSTMLKLVKYILYIINKAIKEQTNKTSKNAYRNKMYEKTATATATLTTTFI